MTQFISRAYNTFEVDPDNKAVVIKRSKETRLKDEIEYYQKLPGQLAIFYPRVLYSLFKQNEYEMRMEYYAYDNLGNLMIKKDYDEDLWKKIFEFIFSFLKLSKEHYTKEDSQDACRSMYIEKTEREYGELLKNFEYFKLFEDHDTITLNGQTLKTFRVIWPKIKKHIEDNYLNNSMNYVHGDFCFSNILYGCNPINGDVVLKFIDPRGSFGKIKNFGDPYYDLAKLLHSCDGGYEYYITDNFKVQQKDLEFTLAFSNDNRLNIKNDFQNILESNKLDLTKTLLLEGTIFVGMCARHYDSLERQKAMFLTGLRILNEVYESI